MLVTIVIGVLPLMFREQYRIFRYFDLISCYCFVTDYLLRWITADLHSKKNKVMAFVVYQFTLMAIVDLPFYPTNGQSIEPHLQGDAYIQAVKSP
ncbi:MAG: hypothetical protein HXK22_04915 [Alloprevotella tannerae]|nr:hypothetical protein [Alloprevotella tannerae]